MIKLLYYETKANKLMMYEQFVYLVSLLSYHLNISNDIIEISDINIISQLCVFLGKKECNKIDSDAVSFLYVDDASVENIESVINHYIDKLQNNGLIYINNCLLSNEYIELLENRSFEIKYNFGCSIISRREKKNDITQVLDKINTDSLYYLIGMGIGDTLLGLSMIQHNHYAKVNVIVLQWLEKYCFDFVKEQPYIDNIYIINHNNLLDYINKNNGKCDTDFMYIENMCNWYNEYYGKKIFDGKYSGPSLYNANENSKLLKPVFLPQKSINWAENILQTLDRHKKIYLILPYSWTSLKDTQAWQGWHNFLTFFPSSVPDATCVFIGTDWDTSIYKKTDNIIDLVDKTPDVSCLYALAKYADIVFTTMNSMSVYCISKQYCTYMFESIFGSKFWYPMFNIPTTKIIPYSFTYSQFKQFFKNKIY